MGIYQPADILGQFGMAGLEYAPKAWGHVVKNGSLLVVERYKPDDLMRKGELTLPGGGVREGETEIDAAQRETVEETGVVTAPGNPERFTCLYGETPVLLPREKLTAVVEPDGRFWFLYTDSGKRYTGNLSDLVPLSEPRENEAESRRPRYMNLDEIRSGGSVDFTPLCQVFLESMFHEPGTLPGVERAIPMEASAFYGGQFLRKSETE